MGDVITFPERSGFGACPRCGRNDGYLNAGPEHWFICRRHRLKWWAGSNLFSGWRNEPPERRWAQRAELALFVECEPR